MTLLRCSSSLRERPIEGTLAIARELAPRLGITRVTEITQLDRIGLPVFVSIRPDAEHGSVCVNAGKGLRAIEAEVGATMESIELAWAEHRRCRDQIAIDRGSVRDLEHLVDLAPRWGTALWPSEEIALVRAVDIRTGAPYAVPAECVFHPLSESIGGARYFGTSSNGLASGNSTLEAMIHGLAEVIERDVVSFHELVDRPIRVANATLPAELRELDARLEVANFRLVVRWLPNPFGIPAFSSVIYDRAQPELTSFGDGLHPDREIALVRSVVESAQARLGLIHGGRDDLVDVYARYAHLSEDQKSASFERRLRELEDGASLPYAEVPDHAAAITDLASVLDLLTAATDKVTHGPILRVVYTPADYPISVVRVIVPGLEVYTPETRRIGRRLHDRIRQLRQ